MEDRTFLTNNHPTNGISDTFREFIEALVEEVVINGEPFDSQKKWLRKHSECEGVSYETIESNLNDLFEAIKELEEHESKVIERSVKALAEDCYLSEDSVNKLIDHAAAVRTQKEVEKKAQEEGEQKAREEAERKAREERDRIAKEKAQLQKKLDAERKAKEDAERKAFAEKRAWEEAERKAREEKERIAKEEEEHKAIEEAEHQEKMRKAEALFQRWVNYYPSGMGLDYKKLEECIYLLKESAALGYPKAQNYLSDAYKNGLGVKRDFEEAFRLSMASALQDNRGGQCAVGVAYLYGTGVEPNDEQAFSWLNKSAQAGNPLGMVYLAICYRYGIGTARDLEQAEQLISKAKEIAPQRASYFSRLTDTITFEFIESMRHRH